MGLGPCARARLVDRGRRRTAAPASTERPPRVKATLPYSKMSVPPGTTDYSTTTYR